MPISQMLRLLKGTGMSFEELAPYFGVSNMTIRRWYKESKKSLPPIYETSVREGLYKLVEEKKLSLHSKDLKDFLDSKFSNRFAAALSDLDIDPVSLHSGSQQEKVELALTAIGQNQTHRTQVLKRA